MTSYLNLIPGLSHARETALFIRKKAGIFPDMVKLKIIDLQYTYPRHTQYLRSKTYSDNSLSL